MLKNEILANFLVGEILALRHMLATQLIRFDLLAAGQVGQGSQGFGSRSMGGHQPPVGGRPDARERNNCSRAMRSSSLMRGWGEVWALLGGWVMSYLAFVTVKS